MPPFNTAALILLTALLFGCTSARVLENWPEQLPSQRYFLESYRSDPANHPLQSEAEYLTWVVRFYEGSDLMPMGWHDIAESMLIDLDQREHAFVTDRLEAIGARISADWAKDNRVRTIDSAMLSLWGGVMQADFSPEARVAAVELVGNDVEELLAGTMKPEQITERRYVDALGISLDP
ncbi:MAG: hypothetical protein A3H44_11420 [Gammaproteobacteria bacterium RIFCSPLOWO2_02_FULL_57_10]|nr:MAG: hypothetical protein A3H44_11420 [Gammaproteobacteria bacterium RIFCSPLOWO2_02_FULL_57_10]